MDTVNNDLDALFGDFSSYKLTENTTVISLRNNTQFIYLLEGENQALLIDTGWGCDALKELVFSLTDKPLSVINTHYHSDHAGGNYLFDEVMVSDNYGADSLAYKKGPYSYLSNYLHYKIKRVNDMEIDLGGRHLYIIKLKPAHSYSSLFIYDETNKMLFCGDEIDAKHIVMFDTSEDAMNHYDLKTILANYASNLTLVKDLDIDFLLPSHNFTPISREYLDDLREMAERGFTPSLEKLPLSMPDLKQSSFASQLCTVHYKKATMIVMKQQFDDLFGEK